MIMNAIALTDIAKKVGGHLFGDRGVLVERVVPPKEAEYSTDLVLALDKEHLAQLPAPPARAAIIAHGMEPPSDALDAWVSVDNPRLALAGLLRLFSSHPRVTPGIHPSAVVEESAKIGEGSAIGALAYVGPDVIIGANVRILPQVSIGAGSRIGDECLIHSGVRIGEDVRVGRRVIIQPNACIGADGFSFTQAQPGSVESARDSKQVQAVNAEPIRIDSVGSVVLEDDVEVGACTTIDRATVGNTVVGRGTKLDNLVMVAHNNRIGENCLIAGQTGIAGSCVIGDRVVMAGKVGIADHRRIGNDAVLTAGTMVAADVRERAVMIDIPSVPYGEFVQRYRSIGRLKQMLRDILKLKERVAHLEKRDGRDS